MKQCSICGYLFQPDESQPLRCPRCGMPLEEQPSLENTPEENAPEVSPEQPAEQPSEKSAGEPELKSEDPPAETPQEDNPPRGQQPEEIPEHEPEEPEEVPSDESEQQPAAAAENPAPSSSVPSDTAPSAFPKKKRKWPKLLALFLLLIVVAVISFFLGMGQQDFFSQQEQTSSSTEEQTQSSTGVYYDPQGVSSEEFAQLHVGMTYAQISAIIGGDAYQTTVPDVSGSYSAAWQGQDDPDAVLTVRFVNGQAVDIQQSGLEEEDESSQDSESETAE